MKVRPSVPARFTGHSAPGMPAAERGEGEERRGRTQRRVRRALFEKQEQSEREDTCGGSQPATLPAGVVALAAVAN